MKVFDLELPDNCYYIKRESIVAKIPFGNRTFYTKFEKINESLTQLIFDQHLSGYHIIAASIIDNDKTDYLVIEYKGEDYQKFFHLVKHLLQTQQIENYQIYEGKQRENIQVFINVDQMSMIQAEEKLELLSSMLEQKLHKQWKCLPSSSLPEEYNIVTLPYRRLY